MQTSLTTSKSSNAYAVRYSKKLLKLQPGLGETGKNVVDELTKSEIPASMALMLIDVMYNPSAVACGIEGHVVTGRGQATKLKWFTEAMIHKFGHRLVKARKDITAFRNILLDLSEIEELRANADLKVTFQEAFILFEAGIDADTFNRMVDDLDLWPKIAAKYRILRAIRAVEAGVASTIEGHLKLTDYRRND